MEFSGLRVDDKLVADVTAFGQTNWVWLTAGSVACVLLTFFWRRPRQPKPPKPVDPRLRTYKRHPECHLHPGWAVALGDVGIWFSKWQPHQPTDSGSTR